MKILETEAIRFIDGRYSKGFVDRMELLQLIEDDMVIVKPCNESVTESVMCVYLKDESE